MESLNYSYLVLYISDSFTFSSSNFLDSFQCLLLICEAKNINVLSQLHCNSNAQPFAGYREIVHMHEHTTGFHIYMVVIEKRN